MAQIFTLTDGTTTIDFLDSTGPYYLGNWETGINQWKDGGVYTDNPLASGSIPIFRQFDTFEEKLTIHITGSSQDDVISNLRSLVTILESGIEYFISGFGNQCYIQVKGDTETNSRYAVIVGYKLEELPGQFIGTPVTGGSIGNGNISSIFSNLEIVLRRGIWLESPPGTEISAYLDSQVTYNSVDLGVDNSNTQSVMVPNYRTESNITHIYRFDVSTGTWSSNLIGSSLPYNLFPSPVGVGDILYIGTITSATNAGPIANIIFNIGTATTMTAVAEYWNGSSWSQDTHATGLFSSAGIHMYTFFEFSKISRNLLTEHGGSAPNIDGYWYRFVVDNVGSGTVPTQANLQLYTSTTPYIDVQTTGISGDVDAITKLTSTFHGWQGTGENQIIIGRRKVSRGTNFTSYINLCDIGNPSGITVNTASWSVADDNDVPLGRSISRTRPGFVTVSLTIDSTISSDFVGKYRAFIRFKHDADGIGIYGSLTVMASGTTTSVTYPESESKSGPGTIEVLDFGIVEIPAALPRRLNISAENALIVITLRAESGNTVDITYTMYDLILIPVDEVVMEVTCYLTDGSTAFGKHRTLILDKITSPEESTDGIVIDVDDYVTGVPIYGGSDGIYCSRDRHRFWIFSYEKENYLFNDFNKGYHKILLESRIYKLNRYMLPRGNS